MMACNIFNTLLPAAMCLPSVGLINPWILFPFMFYQLKTFQALKQFKQENASVASAKNVKKTAYMPFVILLLGFFGTTGYNKFNERRNLDKQLFKSDFN